MNYFSIKRNSYKIFEYSKDFSRKAKLVIEVVQNEPVDVYILNEDGYNHLKSTKKIRDDYLILNRLEILSLNKIIELDSGKHYIIVRNKDKEKDVRIELIFAFAKRQTIFP